VFLKQKQQSAINEMVYEGYAVSMIYTVHRLLQLTSRMYSRRVLSDDIRCVVWSVLLTFATDILKCVDVVFLINEIFQLQ